MASTLFIGNILTLDEITPRAGAVLVEGERITAIGTERELRAMLPEGAAIVELGDRVLMPGLIEPHGHPIESAVLLSENVVDIRPVVMRDPEAIFDRIRAAIVSHSDGVMANGWDPLLPY